MALPTRRFRPVIKQAARLFGLPYLTVYPPAVWLEAMILQESSGEPKARRYEPALDRGSSQRPDQDAPGQDDLMFEDDASYGLMQLLGSTYKDVLGIPQASRVPFNVLFHPIVNIGIGCLYLAKLVAATDNSAARALCRYNGGGLGDQLQADGRFRRQEYVDAILRRCPLVEDDLALEVAQGTGL